MGITVTEIMTDTKQPEALRLADAMERFTKSSHWWTDGEPIHIAVAAELRRLQSENEQLRAGYDAARLEIESLQAQLAAVGAGGVEPLRKRECLHQITEPDHFRGATKMVAEADHFAESVISPIDALKAIAVESAVFAEIQKGIDASHPANDGEKARMQKAADRIAKIMELYFFSGNHGQPT